MTGGARLRADGQGRQGWSFEDKLGLGCARLGWAGLDWTRGEGRQCWRIRGPSTTGGSQKSMTLFFSTCWVGRQKMCWPICSQRGRKSRRVQVNAAAAWRDEDCRGRRDDEWYVGKKEKIKQQQQRRETDAVESGEVHDPEQTSESRWGRI